MSVMPSEQELSGGDGYIEFTVGEATTLWLAGLSHANTDTTFGDVDFAFRLNGGGWADVMENGTYQSGGDTPYSAGDVFRIASPCPSKDAGGTSPIISSTKVAQGYC